jgi:hypothetical protein
MFRLRVRKAQRTNASEALFASTTEASLYSINAFETLSSRSDFDITITRLTKNIERQRRACSPGEFPFELVSPQFSHLAFHNCAGSLV